MVTGLLNQTGRVDNVFFFIVAISVVILSVVTFTMIFFLIKFSRRRNPVAKDIESNLTLEIVWIAVPTILVMAMFYYGWSGFRIMRNPPEDAMPVKVSARQWAWSFTYENGQKSSELRVPVNKPVKLIITSEDVLHSLFIPAFRVKEDAVPGMETYLWFLPDTEGEYDLFCTEYCGVGHHSMISKVIVMPQEEYAVWYGKKEETPDALKIMEKKGCLACHTTDGAKAAGPSFRGIFGKKETVITGGKERTVIVDEAYLRKSILASSEDIVKGYPPVMPSQEGLVSDEEIELIIDYIKGLK